MRRYTSLALAFAVGIAAGWLINNSPSRPHTAQKPGLVRPPDRITVGRPEPASPSGRAWHTLHIVPPAGSSPDQKLTDEWVVTILTDHIESGGGVTAVSYTAK